MLVHQDSKAWYSETLTVIKNDPDDCTIIDPYSRTMQASVCSSGIDVVVVVVIDCCCCCSDHNTHGTVSKRASRMACIMSSASSSSTPNDDNTPGSLATFLATRGIVSILAPAKAWA